MNPWERIPYNDYELHMKDKTVGQLQELSNITKINLEQYKPETVLFFGCGGGNGFEHINKEFTRKVIGIDINSNYLEICRSKFSSKGFDLELICCDIEKTQLETGQIDYISCTLFLEYVDWQKLILQIKELMHNQSILNIVIQKNNNNQFVSKTGIESLNVLSSISRVIFDEDLENYLQTNGMWIISKKLHELPNGKEFASYNIGL
jgi:SAM-dependent methyltransferase